MDPAVFNHPLALQTEWTPLHQGGTSYRSYYLVQTKSDLSFGESEAHTNPRIRCPIERFFEDPCLGVQ